MQHPKLSPAKLTPRVYGIEQQSARHAIAMNKISGTIYSQEIYAGRPLQSLYLNVGGRKSSTRTAIATVAPRWQIPFKAGDSLLHKP